MGDNYKKIRGALELTAIVFVPGYLTLRTIHYCYKKYNSLRSGKTAQKEGGLAGKLEEE